MITEASATSRIRIIPGKADAITPTATGAAKHPGKQLMSMQLTFGSGEQTFHEATRRGFNEEAKSLTLLSYSYYITDISKPADLFDMSGRCMF